MVNTNFLSRRKMTEEIERLQRDNRRLIEGGRPSAAAALIVAELAKLVPLKDIKALETGETFVAYWRKVLEERSEALKVVEYADDEDWRRLFAMIDDSGPGRFWKEVLSDWRTFLSKLKGSMS